jgi:uncharacterized protein (TIGR02646 family)
MRKIVKGNEPLSLSQWKRLNPQGTYHDLMPIERQDIRNGCTAEQYFLCAYCCQHITGENEDTVNEHVEAQSIAPNRSLDFSNIVASCTTSNQCDKAHKAQVFSLTPFMNECEYELKFSLSGRVSGATEKAKETIQVLNLGDTETNNKALIEKRKSLVQSILWGNGVNPDDGIEDNELINMLIDDISTPNNGKLEAFSPVTVNVLRQWIA